MGVLKFTNLLLLFLVAETVTSAMYKCMNQGDLMNCNPRVRIIKSDKHYKLVLCFNDTCIGDNMPNWKINCNDVCRICYSLLGPESTSMKIKYCACISVPALMYDNYYLGCAVNKQCEKQVDTFLNNHCESAELTSQEMTTPV